MRNTVYILLMMLVIQVAFGCKLDDEEFKKKYQIKIRQRASESEQPQIGYTVVVDYSGRLLTGQVFDSSIESGEPFSFIVGVGQVIKCWDEVILVLSVGDQVTIICPSDSAYGPNGIDGVIPPVTYIILQKYIKIERRFGIRHKYVELLKKG